MVGLSLGGCRAVALTDIVIAHNTPAQVSLENHGPDIFCGIQLVLN